MSDTPPASVTQGGAPAMPDTALDYSRRDYEGLRQLLIAQLAQLVPDNDWGHPANPMAVLVEALAASGDYLSYRLDAATTEGYLPTARLRLSVKRHARMLDYRLDDGCNARTWLTVQVSADVMIPAGTQAVTAQPAATGATISPEDGTFAFVDQTVWFETLQPAALRAGLNALQVQSPDGAPSLVAGATSAVLLTPDPPLSPGAWLALANGPLAQVVRITGVAPAAPAVGPPAVTVTWHPEDALSQDLPFAGLTATTNVLLLDQGKTTPQTFKPPVPAAHFTAYDLPFSDIVRAPSSWLDPGPQDSAASALRPDPSTTAPQMSLVPSDPSGPLWTCWPDLLSAGRLTPAFAADFNQAGQLCLRFGDGVLGRAPGAATFSTLNVREGGGAAGNIAAGALQHLVVDAPVTAVSQPLAAAGGADPEDTEDARRYAPDTFRDQARIACAQDAAAIAYGHPMVRRATATATSQSFNVHVDPVPPYPAADVVAAVAPLMARALPAGSALELRGPAPVSVDLGLVVHVAPGANPVQVIRQVAAAFGQGPLKGDTVSFFDPANRPMGAPVFFSDVAKTALGVAGVAALDTSKAEVTFTCDGQDGYARGFLALQPDQIPVAGTVTIRAAAQP